MWFESQNCAMMGLQATTGKRKLEAATAPGESSPAKNGRWEADDCIARLQAVAVPSDAWRAATLLSDDFEDDEDFDDDLSDDDRCVIGVSSMPETARFTQAQPHHHHHHLHQQPHHHHHHQHHVVVQLQQQAPTPYPHHHHHHHHHHHNHHNPQQQQPQPQPQPQQPPQHHQQQYWQYYQPAPQQTIRCEENGKSYLELGTAPPPMRTRCCDGRTRWCHVPCYRQRRLAVLNLSMCKLARYRQCSDPSLRRSVLICNTLRRLEREMEAEPPEQPSYPTATTALPVQQTPPLAEPIVYESSLREMTSSSGRATPFPQTQANDGDGDADADSGIGDDETTRPINWGSVLSLTSQTDLESLNNHELYAELGLTSDFEWGGSSKDATPRADNEWDGFMHVLVGGS